MSKCTSKLSGKAKNDYSAEYSVYLEKILNERLNAKVVEIEWDQKEMKSTFEERLRDRGTVFI